MKHRFPQIPLEFDHMDESEMIRHANDFHYRMSERRTVRHFSQQPVPQAVIESCIHAAGSAPSGANRQPWHFVVVSNPDIKRQIRIAAEKEEHEFYHGSAPDEWLDAVQPLGTDEKKPFLEIAPYLIVIFAERFQPAEEKQKNYYVQESVGIATGILISALHLSGLATLTHTPSPMHFLNEILDQPKHRKPYLILVAGFPTKDATVPDISRKDLTEISTFV